MMQAYWLPTIRAAIAIESRRAAKGSRTAEVWLPNTNLGEPVQWPSHGTLYPVYVRGEAYLRAGDGMQAAAEFQKMIDHRGIVCQLSPGRVLAHLRAAAPSYTIDGDTGEGPRSVAGYKDSSRLGKRRSRYPHTEAGESGVREVAVVRALDPKKPQTSKPMIDTSAG